MRSGTAALPRWKAPRKACRIEPRMPHSVQAAPVSIAPTAIGRIWLYQMVKTWSDSGNGPLVPARRVPKSGLRKSANGTSTNQARTPPAKLIAPSSKPIT